MEDVRETCEFAWFACSDFLMNYWYLEMEKILKIKLEKLLKSYLQTNENEANPPIPTWNNEQIQSHVHARPSICLPTTWQLKHNI